MTIRESTVSAILAPHGANARNSEGDFIRLKDGRILFAFSYYHDAGWDDGARCDIRAVVSADGGRTFAAGTADGEARLLVDAANFGEKNVMSVSLLRMQNGDIGLFYLLKHADGTDEMLLSRSSDEGETFGTPVPVLPGRWLGYYVVNNCRAERLRSGRILIPAGRHEVAFGEKNFSDGRSFVCFFASDDDGATWSRLPQNLYPGAMPYSRTGFQEPGVTELPDGSLYAYFRTDAGFQYESFSRDGTAWTAPQPSRFTSPASPMKISRNPFTGKYYAVWNPIPNYVGRTNPNGAVWGRTPLAIAESADGLNFDFAHMAYVEDDPARGFCYPASFFTDERTLLLAYCSGGGGEETACLQRLTIRRITLG